MGNMIKAQEEIESKVMEKAKEEDILTQDKYHQLVTETIKNYGAKGELDEVEIKAIQALLKTKWYEIRDSIAGSK